MGRDGYLLIGIIGILAVGIFLFRGIPVSIISGSSNGEDETQMTSGGTRDQPSRLMNVPMIGSNIDIAHARNIVNEEGEEVDWSTYEGRPLVVGFIYTSCPMANMCPRFTKRMREVAELTKGSSVDPYFVSISFDPEVDRPEALREYRDLYNVDYENWDFWTSADGSTAPIDRVLQPLGIHIQREEDEIGHNMRLYITDSNHEITAAWGGSNWKPKEVHSVLQDLSEQSK